MRIWQLNGTFVIFFRTFISLWLKRNWINNEKRYVYVYVYWAILIVISHFINILLLFAFFWKSNQASFFFCSVLLICWCCSVTQSCLSTLQPHGLSHARLSCPSLSPLVCSNSCPWSRWCHPTILFSVAHFSSYSQSFPASGSFPMSWLFTSGGQSIGVWA